MKVHVADPLVAIEGVGDVQATVVAAGHHESVCSFHSAVRRVSSLQNWLDSLT